MIKLKHRVFLFISVIIGIILMGSCAEADMNESLEKGIISVDQLPAKGLVQVDGKWEFYWHKLYIPEDFKKNSAHKPRQLVVVPQTWSNYKLEGKNLPQTGFATFASKSSFQRMKWVQ
ncbi:hypothetical protein [Bacillus sp. EB600]|uniref:hypothetical protein n=1 Tax=Bacillus sp. EB600 TaxID=2806345 RepID=UPI00210DF51D|nr:hypothetical protein [Bacillus sp. EB600]MCQ6277636.1 hypothetical protein [Bacillus sp. EB600]